MTKGLKHIEVEGKVLGIDFEDGVLLVRGPDQEYLNNILSLCKQRFNRFAVGFRGGNPRAVAVTEMEHVLTDDAEYKEKCHVAFGEPVHAAFRFSESEGLLAVEFGSTGRAARPSLDEDEEDASQEKSSQIIR